PAMTAPSAQQADTILHNALVTTMDPDKPDASAVALNGVDDDVGGVSLRNGGPVWLRDADRVLKAS
ncbi:MAG: hypothetical protein AAFR09_01775, partial [Pseudomonadota bacterium]